MPMTVRLRDAAEYSEAAQKMFELSRVWFGYDFTRPPAMSRVMAWDPEFGGPHGRAMKRAMAELQQGLWVVKTEERYEPTFSYRWDLVEAWLPGAVAEGRRLSRERALERLIERYTRGAIFSNERVLARLFGLRAEEVTRVVGRLVTTGALRADCIVDGWPGRWLVHA